VDRFFDLALVIVADHGNQPPHQLRHWPVPASSLLSGTCIGTCTAHLTWPPPSA
jgi:hypothetical protein